MGQKMTNPSKNSSSSTSLCSSDQDVTIRREEDREQAGTRGEEERIATHLQVLDRLGCFGVQRPPDLPQIES